MPNPSSALQAAILRLTEGAALTPQQLVGTYAGSTSLDEVLKCLRFLEAHNRVRAIRLEDGQYVFRKEYVYLKEEEES